MAASYLWRTRPDGVVVVDSGDGLEAQPGPASPGMVAQVAASWRARVGPIAAAYGVPLAWALAVITAESRGDAAAISTRGAVGLMQVMPSTAGLPAAALLDWRTNVNAGLALLSASLRLGCDLPKAASRYNAGAADSGAPHASSTSPWGMREQPGYISAVVGASNYLISSSSTSTLPPSSYPIGSPACRRALADADARWPSRSRASDGIMGDAAHQQRPSDHNVGLAVDITADPVGCRGELVAQLAAQDPRTRYVIWSRHILAPADGRGWRPYSGADPHETHVHVSVRPELARDARPWPWSPRSAARSASSSGVVALVPVLLLLWRFLR